MYHDANGKESGRERERERERERDSHEQEACERMDKRIDLQKRWSLSIINDGLYRKTMATVLLISKISCMTMLHHKFKACKKQSIRYVE